jgi:hypothetical protein
MYDRVKVVGECLSLIQTLPDEDVLALRRVIGSMCTSEAKVTVEKSDGRCRVYIPFETFMTNIHLFDQVERVLETLVFGYPKFFFVMYISNIDFWRTSNMTVPGIRFMKEYLKNKGIGLNIIAQLGFSREGRQANERSIVVGDLYSTKSMVDAFIRDGK